MSYWKRPSTAMIRAAKLLTVKTLDDPKRRLPDFAYAASIWLSVVAQLSKNDGAKFSRPVRTNLYQDVPEFLILIVD